MKADQKSSFNGPEVDRKWTINNLERFRASNAAVTVAC